MQILSAKALDARSHSPPKPSESTEPPEPVSQPAVPLDDRIQEPVRWDRAGKAIHAIQQTYHLERRLFL